MHRRTLILAALGISGTAGLALGFRLRRGSSENDLAQTHIPDDLTEMGWRLINQNGNTVTPQTLIGRPLLVFFGFTYCPDICPTTLADIASWRESLNGASGGLESLLITVDPERDTPAVLADYITAFDMEMTALTGDISEVAAAAAAFRVTYRKVPDDSGGYTMDHTSGVFLYRADGTFSGIIDFHEDRSTAIPKIKRILL